MQTSLLYDLDTSRISLTIITVSNLHSPHLRSSAHRKFCGCPSQAPDILLSVKLLHDDNIFLIDRCDKINSTRLKIPRMLSRRLLSFSWFVSTIKITRLASVSICNFWLCYKYLPGADCQQQILKQIVLIKRLICTSADSVSGMLQACLPYTHRRFPPFANNIYSSWCSSKILKTRHP